MSRSIGRRTAQGSVIGFIDFVVCALCKSVSHPGLLSLHPESPIPRIAGTARVGVQGTTMGSAPSWFIGRRGICRGMVLIVVLVVVAMMSLAGLSFVAMMHVERKAAEMEADQLRLEAVVDSGTEWLKAFFEQPWRARQEAGGSWDNPDLFRGILVLEDQPARRHARFTVLSPREQEGETIGLRFGTENESARLNLGALVRWDAREPGAGRRALMALPGMTESVADAILDWIDADSSPRPSGAEADYYQGMGLPYAPRNGVPQCLEELLLVRGVSRDLLFGADVDANHRVDPAERRAASERSEAGGGTQHMPWASLLTVASAERNETPDGHPRIDLNDNDLVRLQQRLDAVWDRRWGRFVLAYRQFGPYQGSRPATNESSVTINPHAPARFRIRSLLDLIGAKVRIPAPSGGDENSATVLASPFTTEPGAVREYLPKLLDQATVVSARVIPGRINVNLAPRPVLRAIPGMDSALVERILAARQSRSTTDLPSRRHPTWLWTEGLVDLPRMKTLLPYLTTGGDVHRAQVVGFFDESALSMRVEVVVDAAVQPPRQIYYKDLRPFGRGYASSILYDHLE